MTDRRLAVVADASVIINLNASGMAEAILRALPFELLVTDITVRDIARDRRTGRDDPAMLGGLIDHGLIRMVTLVDADLVVLADLVIGPADRTLDDGEAATLTYAACNNAIPAADERKALAISRQRFPALAPITTVGLMSHPDALRRLGSDRVADAVFAALRNARMRVIEAELAWVIDIVGPARAALCPSLPRRVRLR